MNTNYKRTIGVDIASEKIDLNDSCNKIAAQVPNTVAAIEKKIIGKIDSPADTLVVCAPDAPAERATDATSSTGTSSLPTAEINLSRRESTFSNPRLVLTKITQTDDFAAKKGN